MKTKKIKNKKKENETFQFFIFYLFSFRNLLSQKFYENTKIC